jgi:UDP:flavonoid glycosyltransferase YjiC (YdhE family)
MRALFATTAGEGHFGPMVPFGHALRDAGWDVAVAAPESFASSVMGAGLAHLPFADVPDEIIGPIFRPLPQLPREEANRVVMRDVFARLDTTWALAGMGEAIAGFAPEVVVREPCEFSSYLLAERAGIPHVQVSIGIAEFDELIHPIVVGPLTELGAADPSVLLRAPRATVVPLSFEEPTRPGPAMTHRYRLPTSPTRPIPQWWPRDERPLVYLSFGSVAAGVGFFPGIYRAAIDALTPLDVRILVTTGRAADPAALGPLSANVHVEQWVPQADALAAASVVVGHGGYGTTMGALAAGLPQLVLPLFASDQFVNAARVDAVGAGIGLAGPESVGDIGSAVLQLLSDTAFGVAARTIADEMADQAPIGTFPGHLAAIVDGG